MKKFLGMLTTAALACALCLGLAGCGSSTDPEDPANFVGEYELSGLVASGQETSAADLALMKQWGMTVTLTLDANMGFKLNLFGDASEGTWQVKSANELALTLEDQSVAATVDGDVLKLSEGDTELTFTKVAADEAASAESSSAAASSAASSAGESASASASEASDAAAADDSSSESSDVAADDSASEDDAASEDAADEDAAGEDAQGESQDEESDE